MQTGAPSLEREHRFVCHQRRDDTVRYADEKRMSRLYAMNSTAQRMGLRRDSADVEHLGSVR
jgi:hypothetical protein